MTERLEAGTGSGERPGEGGGVAGGTDLAARLLSPRPFPHEVVALLYVAAGVVVLERLPVTYSRAGLLLAAWLPGVWTGAFILLLVGLRELSRRRRGLPAPIPPRAEAALFLRAALVLLPVLSVHFQLKSFIFLVNPRTWDRFLWEADRTLHLGLSPSLFLTGLFANGSVLAFLDLVYSNLYFLILVVSVPALLVLAPPSRRMAFLAAYSFVWIAGSVLYLAFPSWGPVFVVSDVFAETLRHMPATVRVQEVLFGEISSLVRAPLAPRYIRLGCVAAFPSLHLAVVTAFAVASRWVSRAWFLASLVVVLLMLVGSVVTGYHYLVDGWAGVALGAGACAVGRKLFPDPAR